MSSFWDLLISQLHYWECQGVGLGKMFSIFWGWYIIFVGFSFKTIENWTWFMGTSLREWSPIGDLKKQQKGQSKLKCDGCPLCHEPCLRLHNEVRSIAAVSPCMWMPVRPVVGLVRFRILFWLFLLPISLRSGDRAQLAQPPESPYNSYLSWMCTLFWLSRIGSSRRCSITPDRDIASKQFSFWKYRPRNQNNRIMINYLLLSLSILIWRIGPFHHESRERYP
jgi:hypothetical protein